ncbi:MAG: tRNA (adenosine(37)-N6)-threonylcarbamoyltransferase complex dimerization subunit type 1 TsaB [Spirochaetes bacterium]|nr:tRNA (adenosine(37)-N6)-threonylcarbamoyltransferase complex dimerization subunit type 1 TsaB [Spirochaetota bacterium]
MILCVETATNAFGLSLFDGRDYHDVETVYKTAYSQNVVAEAKALLERMEKSFTDVTEAYADIGPGSFTGIRIGVCFVNTLHQTCGVPLIGVSSLDLLAFEAGRWYNPVVAFIRSRKNEVYAAFYKEERRVTEYLALRKDEFERFIKTVRPAVLVSPEEDFTQTCIDTALLSDVEVCFSHPKSRTGVELVRRHKMIPQPDYLKPLYVRNI